MPDSLLRRRSRIRASAWLSGGYFWYFAAVGCLIPFITVYYRHLQFSGFQIGVLTAILPLGIAFIAPLCGTLADTFSAHRLLLRSALVLAGLTALVMAQVTSFLTLVPLMILLAVCLAAVPAMLDGFAMLISAQEGVAFGRLRVWGSVGYILTVWIVAWQMGQQVSNFFLIAYAVSLLLTGVSTLGLPRVPALAQARQPMWRGISSMVRNPSVALVLLTVYLVTSSANIMSNYLSIYITELGGTAQMIGTASAIAAISEMPVLIFGHSLLNRFSSRKILALAIAVYFIRFLLYSLPLPGYWILSAQVMHGLSFGLYLMASVTLVHELAGRERAATAQGLLSSTSFGFGAITGALVGGALLDRLGAVGIFQVAAVGMFIALVVGLFTVRAVGAADAQGQRLRQLTDQES
ncbi:MAG TPA: MFS transporter [Herpetosiphonaceae bacterium]